MESLLRKPAFPQLFGSRSTEGVGTRSADLERFAGLVKERLGGLVELLVAQPEDRIVDRLGRLESLTEGVLEYCRADEECGPLELVDAQKVVFDVRERLSPPPGFVVEAARELPIFWTAKADLERVLTHLVDNAIRHHDRDEGHVEVAVHTRGRKFLFSVSDDGPGIPREERDRVLGVFETGHPRTEARGNGLGLAIVRRLVERHCGTLTLGTAESGRGTRVELEWSQG